MLTLGKNKSNIIYVKKIWHRTEKEIRAMTIRTNEEKMIVENIREVVEDFKENKLVELWNEFCDKNYYEERIYYLSDDEINDFFSNKTPAELIRMGSNVDLDNKYFYFHLGELNTTDNIFDVVDIDELVDYIIDNDNDCNDTDIRDLLDELEEVE